MTKKMGWFILVILTILHFWILPNHFQRSRPPQVDYDRPKNAPLAKMPSDGRISIFRSKFESSIHQSDVPLPRTPILPGSFPPAPPRWSHRAPTMQASELEKRERGGEDVRGREGGEDMHVVRWRPRVRWRGTPPPGLESWHADRVPGELLPFGTREAMGSRS